VAQPPDPSDVEAYERWLEPTIVVPCVKPALQAHPAYAANLHLLESAGVRFLSESIVTRGPDGLAALDWPVVVQHLSRITRAA
jgi:hypothetical protein